jgi:CRP/FNR family cyclic AMP-dependent transcriptional regulator
VEGNGGMRTLLRRHGETYRVGDVVFRQGDIGKTLFVVLIGSVELSVRDGSQPPWIVRRVGTGEMFGETSCFWGLPHSVTATVREDAELVRLTQDEVLALVHDSPEFALRVIRTMADRVRSTTQQFGWAAALVSGGH